MVSSKVPIKYITTLIDAYPRPLTQSELAKRSSVTKSAISKIRESILEFCDVSTLAYKRRLLLKSDFDTFMEIFHVYFLQSETEELFKSDYAKTVINPKEIYYKFSQGLKGFSFTDYFDKEDVEWAIDLILRNISSFRIQKDSISIVATAFQTEIKNDDVSEVLPYIQLASKFMTDFGFNIRSEEELKKTLTLRDKVYLFAKDNISRIISQLDVIKEIADAEERKVGIRVLSKLADRIMGKIGEDITEHLWQQAKLKEIPFPEDYREIRTFPRISEGR
ncbi:MAG: hypothetical protein OEY88_04645 [Candidatus Bathyarchaeota archaeon]|nr:hypothetical protein [Candidatus Bathyarchaeota archaeon]